MNAPLPPLRHRDDIVTEDSAALEFVDRFRDCLRFDHSAGAWFRFDGATWCRDGTRAALEWAREIVRELAAAARDDRTRAVIGRAGFAKGVETLARVDQRIAVEAAAWDRDPFLLGTPGGTVDLRNGQLREPDPADLIAKSAAIAPAARADCPRFLAFLCEACGGDDELVAFLQRWFGYCLTGDIREHALVFFIGDGGNGKSALLNTFRSIMSDYAASAAMDTFIASFGDKHPADMAALAGARMVCASETEHGRAWDETRLKQMTGGDPIPARFMRGNYFTFVPTFKLAFAGNHKPDLRSITAAMRRRINIVPFNHIPAQPDPRLEERLRTEWPGILRWAIDGCLDWQSDGLSRPAAILAANKVYFDEQDLFGRWLEDECVVEPGNELRSALSKDLLASWTKYAAANGKKPGRANEFADAMRKRDVTSGMIRRGERGYFGISLTTAEQPHDKKPDEAMAVASQIDR